MSTPASPTHAEAARAIVAAFALPEPLAARILGGAVDGKVGAELAEDVAREVVAVAGRVFGADDPAAVARVAAAAGPLEAAAFAREMRALADRARLAAILANLDELRAAGSGQPAPKTAVGTKGLVPAALSLLIVVGFFGGFIALVFGPSSGMTPEQWAVVNLFAGAMILAFADVRGRWIGSAAGAHGKEPAAAAHPETSPVMAAPSKS
jgi:hypothetical protein